MIRIKTVLCPVDFSSLSDDELQVAVEICETFGARLILHHNLNAVSPVFSKSWEWEIDHPPEQWTPEMAEKAMQALLARIPDSVRVEARISQGLVLPSLLYLVDELPADLLILGSHGWSNEDHASLSDRIIECCTCPVLTIHEGEGEEQHLRLRTDGGRAVKVLVPTDFSESAGEAATFAFNLARTIPVQLELLHVLASDWPAQAVPIDHLTESVLKPRSAVELARQKLRELVPEDLAERVECAVEVGPTADTVVTEAERWKPELIVMGRHARGWFKRFLTRDTSRQLLHRAHCPVWFPAVS